MKYVASKHQKAFMADLKSVYRAAAEVALDELDDKWGKLYPIVIDSWHRKWSNLLVSSTQTMCEKLFTPLTLSRLYTASLGN
tara:strand:- start:72 stop:317 length:246 start_codon:yes stop_codon:yes gene_type:complete